MYILLLFIIVMLGLVMSAGFYYGPSFLNGGDNYIYSQQAYIASHGNFSKLANQNADDTKYIIFIGTALFYNQQFGYSRLTISIFGILCFLLTIMVIFLIGSALYDERAGLLAGFLYSIFPLALMNATNVGDDIPMVFLLSVAVLLVVLAYKRKSRQGLILFLAGFIGMINYLTVSEASLGLIFVSIVVLALFLLKRIKLTGLVSFAVGVAIAILLILLISRAFDHSYTYIFDIYNQAYTIWWAGQVPVQGFHYYLMTMFITRAQANPVHMDYYNDGTAFGYIGWLLLASLIYLAVAREKRALLPGFWVLFAFLYLSFGSQSLTKYVPLQFENRFLLILCPAIMLTISFAIVSLYDRIKSRSIKTVALCAITIVLIAITASSIWTASYTLTSQYFWSEPLMQLNNFVNTLPTNAQIVTYGSYPWYLYSNYQHDTSTIYGPQFSGGGCNVQMGFQNGEYIIGNFSPQLEQCGLQPVFQPKMPGWLENYTAFDNSPTDYWGVSVYYYNSSAT